MRIALFALAVSSVFAQDEPRQIYDSYFGKSRPPATGGAAQVKPEYRTATTKTGPQGKKGGTTGGHAGNALGVTLWRMEAPAPGDGARLLVEAGSNRREFTPHRLQAGELLRQGDFVRLSIESPAEGYLYVVDQELHADGTLGPPYLIFPTQHTRGGDNRVRGGQLVEIPSQTDPFKMFEIKAKGPNEQGEHLTVLLTPAPIPGLKLTPSEQEVPKATFDSWVAQYKAEYQHLELADGEGKAWTKAEQQAGLNGATLLTKADPGPQTIFYFPERAGKAVMAVVRLQIRRP